MNTVAEDAVEREGFFVGVQQRKRLAGQRRDQQGGAAQALGTACARAPSDEPRVCTGAARMCAVQRVSCARGEAVMCTET